MERTVDYGERGQVIVVRDPAALAQRAADLLVSVANQAQAERGQAFVALSGGSTPRQMGELLAREPYRQQPMWRQLHVFWGDERWVPLASDESNAGVMKRVLLDHVPIPAEQVHPFETEGLSPEESAARYEALVRDLVPADDGLPRFDLIFLGMGDDGHTASLFPGTRAIWERERLVVAHYVPKLNATRLTMTPPLLGAGRQVVFLVTGAGKAERLREVLEGPERPDELPAQIVRPKGGKLLWLVDRAAAERLAAVAEQAESHHG
ncbi:MAG TPA: 6-phosphogluconolactonase [Thermomicrobiales bacterium]